MGSRPVVSVSKPTSGAFSSSGRKAAKLAEFFERYGMKTLLREVQGNTMSNERLDPASVLQKFGVAPERIVDYLALTRRAFP